MQYDKAIVESIDSEPESFSWRWRDVDARSIVVVLVLVYVLVLIRTAWVSDDAYITFRTIDNFVNGYGLRWNVAERVQSFTHPLWLFVVTFAYLITGDLHFTSIFLSIAISAAAVLILVCAVARSSTSAILALTVLILSKAFTDYSTSGLENPLTHLLLVVFILIYLRFEKSHRLLLLLSLVAALGTLNRMDTLLLYLPALIFVAIRLRTWRTMRVIAVGFLPFILWEAFAFLYYGSLVPNTAYAKLAAGIPKGEVIQQGVLYLFHSISLDPLTLFVIVSTAVVVLLRRERIMFPLLAGSALYVAYIIFIGGDFMSGRFLTPVLLVAAAMVARSTLTRSTPALVATVTGILIIGLAPKHNPLFSDANYGEERNQGLEIERGNGIADERGFYYPITGLLNWRRGAPIPDHPWARTGDAWKTGDSGKVVIGAALGFAGYRAGPGIHIVDIFGLSDPLLARMPAARTTIWRVGHTDRAVPDGYVKSLETGENHFDHVGLAEFYDKLVRVTRGDLLNWSRITTAIALNLGWYNHLLPTSLPPPMRIDWQDMQTVVTVGSPFDSEGTHRLHPAGAQVDLGQVMTASELEIALDHNDDYVLVFVAGMSSIDSLTIGPAILPDGGMAVHRVDVPDQASDQGYDAIRIFPNGGDNRYSVGHLHFGPADTTSSESPLGTSP